MVPALVARGWKKQTAVGIVGSSALLGMIIPPSIPVIIYALYVNISVGGMFLAGILPGIASLDAKEKMMNRYVPSSAKHPWLDCVSLHSHRTCSM